MKDYLLIIAPSTGSVLISICEILTVDWSLVYSYAVNGVSDGLLFCLHLIMLFYFSHQLAFNMFVNLLLAAIQIIFGNLFPKVYGKKQRNSTPNSSSTRIVIVLMQYEKLFMHTPTNLNL